MNAYLLNPGGLVVVASDFVEAAKLAVKYADSFGAEWSPDIETITCIGEVVATEGEK